MHAHASMLAVRSWISTGTRYACESSTTGTLKIRCRLR